MPAVGECGDCNNKMGGLSAAQLNRSFDSPASATQPEATAASIGNPGAGSLMMTTADSRSAYKTGSAHAR